MNISISAGAVQGLVRLRFSSGQTKPTFKMCYGKTFKLKNLRRNSICVKMSGTRLSRKLLVKRIWHVPTTT